MRLELKDIDDREKGKIGFVLAHGSSFKDDIGRVFELSSDKTKFAIFNAGEARILENAGYEFDLDYWCLSNPSDHVRISTIHENINKYKNVTYVYSDSMDESKAESFLNVNYLPFDFRHFNGRTCYENLTRGDDCPDRPRNGQNYYFCCHDKPASFFQRKTIQEYLRDKYGAVQRYSSGHTIALHTIATALITGCSEIYVFGVDLDYGLGYVDGITRNNDSWSRWIPGILRDMKVLIDTADKAGVKIFNCSLNSPISQVVPTIKFNL